jgi:hypothetical protein
MRKFSNYERVNHMGRRLLPVAAVMAWAVLAVASGQAQASLSLSPAVIMASGTYGQSLTQRLTINNNTPNIFTFRMLAQDIVVRDGKRVFMPAGEAPNSIAATAVFAPEEIVAPPKSSQSVTVTVTLPQKTDIRAIAAIFNATNAISPSKGSVGLVASIGTLITFNLSNNDAITPEPVQIALPTETTNLTFTQVLTNTGTEPVIPKGVAAILNAAGHLVGKATFPGQRLLPGEKLTYRAEYADALKPGDYHVLCTFSYARHAETQQANFTVK